MIHYKVNRQKKELIIIDMEKHTYMNYALKFWYVAKQMNLCNQLQEA